MDQLWHLPCVEGLAFYTSLSSEHYWEPIAADRRNSLQYTQHDSSMQEMHRALTVLYGVSGEVAPEDW